MSANTIIKVLHALPVASKCAGANPLPRFLAKLHPDDIIHCPSHLSVDLLYQDHSSPARPGVFVVHLVVRWNPLDTNISSPGVFVVHLVIRSTHYTRSVRNTAPHCWSGGYLIPHLYSHAAGSSPFPAPFSYPCGLPGAGVVPQVPFHSTFAGPILHNSSEVIAFGPLEPVAEANKKRSAAVVGESQSQFFITFSTTSRFRRVPAALIEAVTMYNYLVSELG